MTIAAWLGGLTRANDRNGTEVSAEPSLTPSAVMDAAAEILERGPSLSDAPILFLAAARHETPQLTPWADIWPRLPEWLTDDSPVGAEILDCAREYGNAIAEMQSANVAAPDVERHRQLVTEAIRGSDVWHDAAQIGRQAEHNARRELDLRRESARTLVHVFEKRLADALKAARRAGR